VTGLNKDGQTVITVLDTKTNQAVPLPKLPAGDIASVRISRDETQLAFYLNGDRAPSNLYVYNFSTGQASKLTDTLSREIDPLDLVESEVVRFKSFDGLTIPSVYYKPHQASARRRSPALVSAVAHAPVALVPVLPLSPDGSSSSPPHAAAVKTTTASNATNERSLNFRILPPPRGERGRSPSNGRTIGRGDGAGNAISCTTPR
jgi:hypothetical protein